MIFRGFVHGFLLSIPPDRNDASQFHSHACTAEWTELAKNPARRIQQRGPRPIGCAPRPILLLPPCATHYPKEREGSTRRRCHHSLFLVGLRLGGHDGERDQRAVGNTLGAIGPQRIVHVQEIQEERGGDALVAVVGTNGSSRRNTAGSAAFSSRVGCISCPPKPW